MKMCHFFHKCAWYSTRNHDTRHICNMLSFERMLDIICYLHLFLSGRPEFPSRGQASWSAKTKFSPWDDTSSDKLHLDADISWKLKLPKSGIVLFSNGYYGEIVFTVSVAHTPKKKKKWSLPL